MIKLIASTIFSILAIPNKLQCLDPPYSISYAPSTHPRFFSSSKYSTPHKSTNVFKIPVKLTNETHKNSKNNFKSIFRGFERLCDLLSVSFLVKIKLYTVKIRKITTKLTSSIKIFSSESVLVSKDLNNLSQMHFSLDYYTRKVNQLKLVKSVNGSSKSDFSLEMNLALDNKSKNGNRVSISLIIIGFLIHSSCYLVAYYSSSVCSIIL